MKRGRWIKITGAGLLSGLVATLMMTLLMLVLRYLFGISPPPESIPDRLAPTIDVKDFFALLRRFGGYNQLKQLGVGGGLLGQLVIGSLGGAAYALVVERGRWRQPEEDWRFGIPRPGIVLVSLAVGLAWAASLVFLWPVLGANFRGLPPGTARWVTGAGLLLSYAVYAMVLLLTYRYITTRVRTPDDAPNGEPIGRRALLVGGVGVVAGLATAGLLRRLYNLSTFSYDGLRLRPADFGPITSNDKFYVVTKNIVDPSVAKSAWRLEVTGMVERPHTYSFGDLTALPSTTQETTLMCISNGVGDTLISNAAWKGVPMRTLLGAASPQRGVVEIVLHGADGYTDTFAIDKAMDPATLVVYEMNGEPLPERHGFPVRVIAPGLFGEKNVKWVTQIELVDHDAKGFYEQQGWGPSFAIPIRSGFYAPDLRRGIQAGSPVTLKGFAFAPTEGVSKVEVSTNGGRSWQPATINHPGTPLSWSLWSYTWVPAKAGNYKLVVRAFDTTGAVQNGRFRRTVPQGATGYHRVTARVQA